MSRRRRSASAAPIDGRGLEDRLEVIALRVHQIAAAVGLIAKSDEETPLSHALYFIEECLRDVETRLVALYDVRVPAGGGASTLFPAGVDVRRRTRRRTGNGRRRRAEARRTTT